MKKILLYTWTALLFVQTSFAQNPWEALLKRAATLGLSDGEQSYHTKEWELSLVKASQTVAALRPSGESSFDFTPGDRIRYRQGDGFYQLGDINFRLRKKGEASWSSFSSAQHRVGVKALPTTGSTLAAADLSPSLPVGIPLQVQRYWEEKNGQLVLRFTIRNGSEQVVEIGALGFPMVFNNILQDRSLDEAHAKSVFFDPYIGKDAGYLQVSRLSGMGKSLLVLPEGKTPFEAYRPLLDDPTPRGITFEGFHEWMVYSKSYAEQEWKGVEQWNTPSSLELQPGEEKEFGFRFVLSDGVKQLESTLIQERRPVAVGIPGYVLPQDVEGSLFLRYPKKVQHWEVYPKGALSLTDKKGINKGIQAYQVRGHQWGQARLTLHYADGTEQTIHYKVIRPEAQVMDSVGHFLTTKQWFEQPDDLFKRSPSVISYDYETKKQITQDSRAWVAGLSDEGGAGSWLEAMMKQLVKPDQTELEKLQQFVHQTLWGSIQHRDGTKKYGVKKSVFYYEPDSMPPGTYSPEVNYKTWSAWKKKEADDVGRSYNYPHVAAAYWVMYRLSRFHQGLVTEADWHWYLEQAFHTSIAMVKQAPYYAQFGQMEGTVFLLILTELKAEGMQDMAMQLEGAMKARADHWRTLTYPFGSEMPWDSTGQEEVYMWSDYFGYQDKAAVTMNAILAYMPTIPHWAYNGNARRYWDFLYGGKLSRVERQIHHYGSALNAIPVLAEYRKHPEDLYLLRVGYGGLLGGISNVTEDGFGPCAFHSYPATLANDALSGDYGSGFFGYAVNTSSYLVDDPLWGWLGFGGNVEKDKDWTSIRPTTAARSAVFIAPAGLWLNLEAGQFEEVAYNSKTKAIRIKLAPQDAFTPKAFVKIQATEGYSAYQLQEESTEERGSMVLDLKSATSSWELVPKG